MANNEIRLQKFMAEQGVASRRKSEELIKAGKVKVNGHVAEIGQKINPRKDLVTVGKQKITRVKKRTMVYIMLHKPRGYVTTVSDEHGRKTVMDLVSDIDERIYPVGRLDKDSEGLLILTNDGSFTNAMTHPSHNYAKVYRVTVRPSVSDEALYNMKNGGASALIPPPSCSTLFTRSVTAVSGFSEARYHRFLRSCTGSRF